MNMLNPTAIADPDNYGPEDIKGLFVRRFKKDIKDQVASSFKERKIFVAGSEATSEEEDGFDALSSLTFAKLDKKRSGSMLFKTTLEKSLFSSPAACLETIQNRVKRLRKEDETAYAGDITQLEDLALLLSDVTPGKFSKYQKLLSVIRDGNHGLGWTGKDPADRLVIFTERIETLKFLHDNLRKDLGLKEEQAAILHGTMSDMDQQAIVESFSKENSPVRILIASDVASEGINLHFLCHKMVHFDIPWSLMVFQQRNGRIDRYGQERDPLIVYLKTESKNEKIKGDSRILELLIQKDEQAVKNIGDPAALMGVYDIEQEESITAKALEQNMDEASFDDLLKESAVDPLAILMGQADPVIGKDAAQARKKMPSMFGDDYSYLKAAIDYVRKNQPLQADFDDDNRTVHITAPKELEARFKFLPQEVLTEDGTYILSSDRDSIIKEIKRSRQEEQLWPRLHLLWERHPILNWANDKVLAAFGRHEAPVMTLADTLSKSEVIFIISGLIPNRKSHPVIHRWLGVRFLAGKYDAVMDFEEVLKRSDINQKTFPNTNLEMKDARLDEMLPVAVDKAYEWMSRCRQEFIADTKGKIENHTEELERLRLRQYKQLELSFGSETTSRALDKKERERREIDRIFKEYRE